MKKYGVDKNGFIITEVGLNKVKPVFQKVLNKIKNEVIHEFGDKIYSLYLYGSVATGKARIKSSDLDLLLILRRKPTPKIKKDIEEFQDNLSAHHLSKFRGVGISLTHTNEVKKDTYGWGCCIKHLCVCLYGENFGKNLPNFKPSKRVAKAFNGDIEKHIKAVLEELKSTHSPQKVSLICSSAMRKIVRTGFCLVMEQEQSWTTDLDKSYEIFSKYYPKQSTDMKKALVLAKKPTTNTKELGKFLNDFGSWLTEEVEKKL
ncbi:MAG: nucleotidyltransferase domain-containing protein [Candidatus Peregrinibacteria bacterium]|nr:nucleotidyltransferase domain-containing protein [Candidatus Peregrinibacteria bacterium]